MSAPQIVWLRRDLRLADQPAFYAAAQAGPVIPVYVLADETAGDRRLGGASRWYLHGSLQALAADLEEAGSRLILRRGDAVSELVALAKETGAEAVHAIRHYERWWRHAQDDLAKSVDLKLYDGNYLLPPGTLKAGSGGQFRIYTPFARATAKALPAREPCPAPALSAPAVWPASDTLESWHLLPTLDWANAMRDAWRPGERHARERLMSFLTHLDAYDETRNLPSIDGSSRMSPHLHWGEISPTQVWATLDGKRGRGADTFRGELIWRDFAQNLIAQFPDYPEHSYRDAFDAIPWRYPDRDEDAARDLKAWQTGRTGYPIVDAGMRQLWSIGWMHNRVRMITASFLIKHLLIDWRSGERWFWDCLIDADYGNNGTNWQWVSGTGVDSSQFTRIMAPLTQSPKFDAAGYIREWVPELADLPDADIHDPPPDKRPSAYPDKIVEHVAARERALDAYRQTKSADVVAIEGDRA